MCDALRELFSKEIDEAVMKGREEEEQKQGQKALELNLLNKSQKNLQKVKMLSKLQTI